MRGFLIAGVSLAFLDLVLQSPVNRVTAALVLPTRWLKEWMDPAVPLIPDKAGTTAATTAQPTSAVLT